MIKAKGMVFGDGLMELIPDETEEKVIWLDDLKEETGSTKCEKRHFKAQNRRKSAKSSDKLSLRDTLILLSVIVPFVFGFLWATCMVQHEAAYIIYWALAYSWLGIVTYANRRKHGRKKD